MKIIKTERGFYVLTHPKYLDVECQERLVGESSAIGDYEDSDGNIVDLPYDKPGSSYLWVGEHHHLNRQEVQALIEHLQDWLRYKRLLPREN